MQRTLRSDQTEGVLSVREAEALWKQSFPYDVVLCDVMMPNSNGADLYESVKRSHPGAEARILFMTGQAFSAQAREMLTRIPNRCLQKPIDAEELEEAVRGGWRDCRGARRVKACPFHDPTALQTSDRQKNTTLLCIWRQL